MNAEVSKIIVEILTAHKSLFPHENWVAFRRKYLVTTGEYSDKEGIFTGDDYTNDRICREVEAALSELEPRKARQFFGYDKKKRDLRCPKCLELRTNDDEWRFAQRKNDGNIKCIACLSVYKQQEYEQALVKYFGYLGEQGQAEVAKETKDELR